MLFPCRESGCPNNISKRGGYCDRHKNNNQYANDSVRQIYNAPAWKGRSGIAPAVKARNPVCQKLKVVNGRRVQCLQPSFLVHHRLSPRVRPDLALSVYDEKGVSQLIALCDGCHPEIEGTPDWVEGVDFVRTEFRLI
jgi:hypothetical protein